MKTPHALAFLVLFALAPLFAHATDVTVTCTGPVARSDGSKITGALTFNLYGAKQGQPKTLLTTVPLAACSSLRTNVDVGTSCYEWTAVEARTDLGPVTGVESAHSAETCATVTAPPSPPSPPTNPQATVVKATAYEIRPNSSGALMATRIGVVPLGTACLSDTRTVGSVTYNRVAPSAIDLINWPGVIPPVDTFAQCG